MVSIVSNASPLIFLARLDRLSLLDCFEVLIPDQVYAEIKLGKENGKNEFLLIDQYINKKNIRLAQTTLIPSLPHTLGEGESAVISLAVKEKIRRVLIDERKARMLAMSHGLEPKGTLAVLIEEKNKGRMSKQQFDHLLTKLVGFGFRISEDLLAKLYEVRPEEVLKKERDNEADERWNKV